MNLSALLSRALPTGTGSAVRSVTAQVSSCGCFLVSFEPWHIGERGWLILTELEDAAPIPVEIRSIRLWGESRAMPGMGVSFITLTESQRAELNCLGGRSFMLEEL